MAEYLRPLLVIFVLMVLAFVFMYDGEKELVDAGITGNVIKGEEARPIQEVVEDLEDAGAERIANPAGLRYADE